MSVTTVANPVSGAVLQALTDYDLHHSGHPERPQTPEAPNRTPRPPQSLQAPLNWDDQHRRVPPYRPANPECLSPERPGGTNAIETVFIYIMLNGVGLVARVDTIWRATGGKINDRIFRYPIGGEW